MQSQDFDTKFNAVHPAINVATKDQKPLDHRVDVDWQYSDHSGPSSNYEFKIHEGDNQFKAIAKVNAEDQKLITNNEEMEEQHFVDTAPRDTRKLGAHAYDKSLTFRSPELKSIKLFLPGTLQKIIPLPVAVLLTLATVVYCLHVFGLFGDKTLVEEEMSLTLTTFKNIIWTLRTPVFTFFGFCYLKWYLDDIPSSFRLPLGSLTILSVKILIWIVIELVLTVVLPAIARYVQMILLPTFTEKKDSFDAATAIMNTIFLILARLLALPILFNFIAEFYLLYHEVKQYEKDIQKWEQGQRMARNYFIDIRNKIKRVEKTFQPFLVVHLGILILMFVPGVLSYVERFNTEGTVTKFVLKEQADRMSDPISLIDPGTMLMNNHSTGFQLTKKPRPLALVIYLKRRQNNTMEERQQQVAERQTKKVLDKNARARIILAALTFLGELLALYLPLILLGKINKTLASIPQTIRYGLKYDEQQESGYLIQNDQVVKEMLRTMEDVEGFQILGMRLTVIKTLLIAVLAPLLTLLFHIIIRDVDISP